MHPIIRLVNRNLTISLNPGFLIWQIIFPLIYIFVAGFAYGPLINQVPFAGKDLDYPAFLASGMIGFNIMNSTLISGILIWNDRRHGMFEQIMSGPFTRSHYILSNICTIGIIGLVSASLIAVVESVTENNAFPEKSTAGSHMMVLARNVQSLPGTSTNPTLIWPGPA